MASRFFGHNFAAVYKFEVVRTLKKPSFWALMLALPLFMAAVFGVSYYAGLQSATAGDNLAKEKFSIGLTDDSRTISGDIISQIGAKTFANKTAGENEVKAGKLDAYFYYPDDFAKNKVEIFAQNVGIFQNSKYQAVAQSLLQNSALAATSAQTVAILQSKINYNVQTFQDGKSYNPLMEMIAPGVFLVLFFLIIVTFGNQMLSATTEEKENRVSEMILTTIKARTLIIGKIFAFLTLILIQVLVIIGLVVIAYFALKNHLNLPSFDLSQIPLDPVRIVIAIIIFFASLLLFSGLLVAIGAAMPTAKEANQWFAIPILLIIMPLYMSMMIISNATSPIINFITFFPFTAPIPLMLRNAVSSLGVGDVILGTVILAVTAIIVFVVAARLFQTGAVQYDSRLSLRGIFAKKKSA